MSLNNLLLRALLSCFLAIGLVAPKPVYAYVGVTIVMSEPSKASLDFVNYFKTQMASADASLTVKVVDLIETKQLVVAENSQLVVALGVKALNAASKLSHTTPVLGVLTPLPTFNAILRKSGRTLGIFSAIVLDQPYQRQIALIKSIYPQARSVGVLLGPNSEIYEDYLKDDGQRALMTMNIEKVYSDVELIPKLKTIFDTNDALLAIPDPVVYNRETAQPILLTSYRYGKPIFGYSQSYVRAGALASVFSNAEHLAKQAVEIAVASKNNETPLPPPRVPKYFSVKVNEQVANSLKINLPSEFEIYQDIKRQEVDKVVR